MLHVPSVLAGPHDSSSVMGRESIGQLSGVGPWAFASTPQYCHLRSSFSIFLVQRLHGIVHSKSLVFRLRQGLSPLAQETFRARSLSVRGRPGYCGVLSSTSGLHSMPGEPLPSGDNHRCPQYPLGAESPPGKNHRVIWFHPKYLFSCLLLK